MPRPVQTLTLIRGHQGSGKSTLAQQMAQADAGLAHVENDHFFTDENGVYAFDFARHAEAKAWCLEKTAAALAEGLSVAVANTFTKIEELHPYLAAAAERGATIHIIEMEHDFANIHGVPAAVIEQRKRDFQPWPGHKTVAGPQGVREIHPLASAQSGAPLSESHAADASLAAQTTMARRPKAGL